MRSSGESRRLIAIVLVVMATAVIGVTSTWAALPCCPWNQECVCGKVCDDWYCTTQGAIPTNYCCDEITGGCLHTINEDCCGIDCSL